MTDITLISELEEPSLIRSLQIIRTHDPYFNHLSDANLQSINQYSTTLEVMKNQVIVKPEEEDILLIVLSGTLLVLLDDQVIGLMTAGHMYGLQVLFKVTERDRPLTIISKTQGYLMTLQSYQINKMQNENHYLYQSVISIVARKIIKQIYKQYKGEFVIPDRQLVMAQSTSNSKQLAQIKRLLSSEKTFKAFETFFDNKDYKVLQKNSKIINYRRYHKIINNKTEISQDLLVLNLEGILKLFNTNTSVVMNTGMIGIESFIFGSNCKYSVEGVSDGLCMIISQQDMTNMENTNIRTIVKLYKVLLQQMIEQSQCTKERLMEVDMNSIISNDLCKEYNERQGIKQIGSIPQTLHEHPVYIQSKLDQQLEAIEKINRQNTLNQNKSVTTPNTSQIAKTTLPPPPNYMEQKIIDQKKNRPFKQQNNNNNMEGKKNELTFKKTLNDNLISNMYDSSQMECKQQELENKYLKDQILKLKTKIGDRSEQITELKAQNQQHVQQINKYHLHLQLQNNEKKSNACVQHRGENQGFISALKSQIKNQFIQNLKIKYGYKWLNITFRKKFRCFYV